MNRKNLLSELALKMQGILAELFTLPGSKIPNDRLLGKPIMVRASSKAEKLNGN
jgi:hypothetical protein